MDHVVATTLKVMLIHMEQITNSHRTKSKGPKQHFIEENKTIVLLTVVVPQNFHQHGI